MTDTAERTEVGTDAVSAVTAWLEENWDPDLTVGEWWERLGLSGWAAPNLPENAYGRGLNRNDSVAVQKAISDFGALSAPGGLGLLLAAPTIAAHGTQEQIDLYVREIVTGQKAWCQLFSEPGAGSDLAGLQTRAIKDGEQWVVTGQKVWTSGGQVADLGMLIARTDPDVPKHQGITYFAIDMHQPGVEIRPLVEMTGHAMFNEVFMEEAIVPDDALIGGLNNGWAVANTTLMNERAGLGSGGGHAAASAATPGTVVKDLAKRAGDFVSGGGGRKKSRGDSSGSGAVGMLGAGYSLLVELAKGNGKIADPSIRQDLVRLHTLNELGRMNNLRAKAAKAAGLPDIPGLPNISKLSMSEIVRQQRDIGLKILGPYGTLHGYTGEQTARNNEATGNPFVGMVTSLALFAQAPPIYGGTDQIQRNIIGERVLGLPKEANNDKTAAFKELPKNA
ncbi:MAG TPA: acyl-CoA dehydrogenase family protein [Acidimicrobiales bacterium]|nr:acyl-CoA dehydrogenase family protein [Acidimicrobiales bacterium]